MKKLLLFTFALFLWTGAWAQDINLCAADGVTATLIKDDPTPNTDVSNALNGIAVQPNYYDSNGEMNIVVDLSESKTIEGFSITFAGDRWVSKFTLSYSADGVSYTKIGDYLTGREAQNPETKIFHSFNSGIVARYIKYTSKKSNKNVDDGYSETIKNFRLLQYGSIPAIPDITSDSHKLGIFSHDLGNTTGYGWQAWSSTTSFESFTIQEKNAIKFTNFTYYGSGFDKIDATGYSKLHLDIYALYTGTIAIFPITGKPEKGIQADVTENTWTPIDINIDDFVDLELNMANLYQIKYVESVNQNNGPVNGGGTHSFIIGNVYLYGTPPEDLEAPEMTKAIVSNVRSTSATLTVSATDDFNRTLSYTVKNGDIEIATGSGHPSVDTEIILPSLEPGTTYDNLKVYATDEAAHNSTDYVVPSFTTLTRNVVKSGNGTITVTQSAAEKSIDYTYEFIVEGNNDYLTLSFNSTAPAEGETVVGWNNNNSFMAKENDGMLKDKARSYTWENVVGGITYGAKCVWPASDVQCKTPYITYSVPEILPEPASLTIDASKVVYNVYCDDSNYKSYGGNHFWQVENMHGEGAVAQEVELASGDHAYSVKLATSFDIRYKDGDVSENGTYYCYIALYPTGDVTSLTITPLFWNNHGYSFVQTVTPNKWNYIYFNEEQYRDAAGGHYAVRISGMEANTIYFDNVFYSATLPVKIGSHGYTTLISDKTLDFGDATLGDLTAYRAKREGTTVTLNKVGEVPANKGLVLQGTANETYYIPVLASTAKTVETDLTGNATADYSLDAGKYYYVLSYVGGEEGFYHYTGSKAIPAGKAFFETDEALSTSSADYMSIIFGDDEPSGETTRINAVNIDLANEAAYNLAGQRVGNDYKGIVIVNGKKYLRK